MKDVHICPILMRTVIWIDGKCTEECVESDCPIQAFLDQFFAPMREKDSN